MIIVFSGTEEGNILIRQLLKKGLSVFASFSSEVGKESIVDILPQNKKLKINNRKLKLEEMLDLIKKNKIKYIIDATHPFAVEVSKNAIDASRLSNIRYIRFERKNIIEKESKNIIYFDSFKSSLEFLEKTRGNVFLHRCK